MGIDMFMYIGFTADTKKDFEVENQGPLLMEEIKKFKEAKASEGGNAEPEEEEDDYGYRRRGSESPESKVLSKFHESRGFFDVLAWSHGSSHSGRKRGGNLQDVSVTRYQDKLTPSFYVMVMRGEIVPFVLLRLFSKPKDGVQKVVEYEFFNASITSLSTGGSGGEDRLTENISVSFQSFKMKTLEFDTATGEIVSKTQGFWDDVAQTGVRDGGSSIPSLKDIVKSFITENHNIFARKDLMNLVKMQLMTANECQISLSEMNVPLRGRKFMVTKEEVKPENVGKNRALKDYEYKEIFVKQLTRKSLLETAAAKFNIPTAKVARFFYFDYGSRQVEIEDDEQVEDLPESSSLILKVTA